MYSIPDMIKALSITGQVSSRDISCNDYLTAVYRKLIKAYTANLFNRTHVLPRWIV